MSKIERQIDDHVGARIRLQRTVLGLSQAQLAAAIRISYQQIQKYETGANRISAGRLFEIGNRLGVDMAYFFDGFDPELIRPELPHGATNRAAIELVRNFLALPNEDLRAALAHLMKVLHDAASLEAASAP